MSRQPLGLSEAGISTTNIDTWIDFLQSVAGWEIIWQGYTHDAIRSMWGIPPERQVKECLMGCPGSSAGRIRLFEFDIPKQEVIRANTNTWDCGGHFDLDVRTRDLASLVSELKRRDWQGVSEPIDWQFAHFGVREWLSKGPDDVIFAIIQRISPPLEDVNSAPERLGQVFNSSQIVADIDHSIEFYQNIGFKKVLHHRAPLAGRGGEVLGLSADIAPQTVVDLAILQPEGDNTGSVELVKIEGASGRDVSHLAKPYNLGLNLLRFPVPDLGKFAADISTRGIRTVLNKEIETELHPYGNTRMIAIETPDGAWLEFFQA